MKKLIPILFVVATIGSCTKKEVDPKVMAEAVVGTYDLNYLSITAGADVTTFSQLPVTQSGVSISGSAELNSTSTGLIDIKILLKVTGKDPSPLDLRGYELKKKGDAYGLYIGEKLAADLDGKNVNFNYSQVQTGGTVGIKFIGKR